MADSNDLRTMTKSQLENLALEFGWDAEGGEDTMDAMTKIDWINWLTANTVVKDGFRQNKY